MLSANGLLITEAADFSLAWTPWIRWCDPHAGRFISQDPAEAGDNWYAYSGNDPINFVDPTGLVQQGNPLNDLFGSFGNSVVQQQNPQLGDFSSAVFGNPTRPSFLGNPLATTRSFDAFANSVTPTSSFTGLSTGLPATNIQRVLDRPERVDVNTQYLRRYATDAAFRNRADDAYSQSLIETELALAQRNGNPLRAASAETALGLNRLTNRAYGAAASLFVEPTFFAVDTAAKLFGISDLSAEFGQRQLSATYQIFNSDPGGSVTQNLVTGARTVRDAIFQVNTVNSALEYFSNPTIENARNFGDNLLNTSGVLLGLAKGSQLNRIDPTRGQVYAPVRSNSLGAAHIYDEAFAVNRHFNAVDTARKHGNTTRNVGGRTVSAAPTRGQVALDRSVRVSNNSPRRVGVDLDNNEIVIFDRTGNVVEGGEVVGGSFHGHVRAYSELSGRQRNALKNAGYELKGGRIVRSGGR